MRQHSHQSQHRSSTMTICMKLVKQCTFPNSLTHCTQQQQPAGLFVIRSGLLLANMLDHVLVALFMSWQATSQALLLQMSQWDVQPYVDMRSHKSAETSEHPGSAGFT